MYALLAISNLFMMSILTQLLKVHYQNPHLMINTGWFCFNNATFTCSKIKWCSVCSSAEAPLTLLLTEREHKIVPLLLISGGCCRVDNKKIINTENDSPIVRWLKRLWKT